METTIGMRQPFLPIPVIPEHTEYIPAGAVTIGVGYRLLNDQIVDAYMAQIGHKLERREGPRPYERLDDGGVSLFVFGEENGALKEHFRLDIFDAQPHYHYVYQKENAQERVLLDPTVTGDPQEWALACLRDRLPQVLQKVGAPELAARVDRAAIEAVIPAICASIERAKVAYAAAASREARA